MNRDPDHMAGGMTLIIWLVSVTGSKPLIRVPRVTLSAAGPGLEDPHDLAHLERAEIDELCAGLKVVQRRKLQRAHLGSHQNLGPGRNGFPQGIGK